jgi:hypothetical protein
MGRAYCCQARAMITTIMTMAARESAARERSVPFRSLGLEPSFLIQPSTVPTGPEGNQWNAKRCLDVAIDAGSDLLFLEDDLQPDVDRFKRALAACEALEDGVVYLYAHEVSGRVRSAYPTGVREQVLRVRSAKSFFGDRWRDRVNPEDLRMREGLYSVLAPLFGSQAVFIKREHVRDLRTFMEEVDEFSPSVRSRPIRPFDGWLSSYLFSRNVPTFVYLPHPVQHLQDRTGRLSVRSDVYSISFDFDSEVCAVGNEA